MSIGGAGAHDPLIQGRQQAHHGCVASGEQTVEILTHDEGRLSLDVDLSEPAAESRNPGNYSVGPGTQALAQPVIDVVHRRRPVASDVGLDGPRPSFLAVGDATP